MKIWNWNQKAIKKPQQNQLYLFRIQLCSELCVVIRWEIQAEQMYLIRTIYYFGIFKKCSRYYNRTKSKVTSHQCELSDWYKKRNGGFWSKKKKGFIWSDSVRNGKDWNCIWRGLFWNWKCFVRVDFYSIYNLSYLQSKWFFMNFFQCFR